MQQLIEWVEKGKAPDMLDATVSMGSNKGQSQKLCMWPMRPLWSGSRNGNGTLECVWDQESVDSWHYDLDAFKVPVY